MITVRYAFCFIIAVYSLQAMDKSDFKEHLRKKALEKSDIPSTCHLIPKFFSSNQSAQAYELCDAVFLHAPTQVRSLFEQHGIDVILKKKADAGDMQAHYFLSLLHSTSDLEAARKYFQASVQKNPRFALWLIDLTHAPNEVIEYAQILALMEDRLSQDDRTKMKIVVVAKLKQAVAKEYVPALGLLLEWLARTERLWQEAEEFVALAEKKKLYQSVAACPPVLFEGMKRWVEQDAKAGYHCGCLLNQAAETNASPDAATFNRKQAATLWVAAAKRDCPQADWALLAYNENTRRKPQAVQQLIALALKARKQKDGLDTQLVSTACTRVSQRANTEADCMALGRLYGQGLGNLMPRNNQRARDFFKIAYKKLFERQAEDCCLTDEWERCNVYPADMTNNEKENRASALFELLDMVAFEKKELRAAILLTQAYAQGLYGVKKDAKKVDMLIRKTIDVHADSQSLATYLDAAALEPLLKDESFADAQSAIAMLLYYVTVFERNHRIPYFLEIIDALMARGAIVDNQELGEKGKKIAQSSGKKFVMLDDHKSEIASAITYHMLKSFCGCADRTNAQAKKLEGELRYNFELLIHLLNAKMEPAPQFFNLGHYQNRLHAHCFNLIIDADVFATLPVLLQNHIRYYTGMLYLIGSKVLHPQYIREACRLLKNDDTDKQNIRKVGTYIEKLLANESDYKLQFTFHYILAVIAYNLREFSVCLNHLRLNVELAARCNALKDYSIFSEMCDPEEDFITLKDQESKRVPIEYRLFMVTHFLVRAKNISDQEASKALVEKASSWIAEAYKLNSFYTDIIMAREYMKGIAIESNPKKGMVLMIAAFEAAASPALCTHDIKEHCNYIMRQIIPTLPFLVDDSCQDLIKDLEKAWKEFALKLEHGEKK